MPYSVHLHKISQVQINQYIDFWLAKFGSEPFMQTQVLSNEEKVHPNGHITQ